MTKRALYLEQIHQACACRALRKAELAGYGLTYAGDQNAAKRGAKAMSEALLTGLRAGEADLRAYIPGPKLIQFELKTEVGRVSEDQKDRHELMESIGFHVHVIQHKQPVDTAQEIMAIVAWEMGLDLANKVKFTNFAIEATEEVLTATKTKR